MTGRRTPTVGIVVIGRNEGARLARVLAAVAAEGVPAVYVDSGSTDGSPECARQAGLEVIELDDSAPHSAARGRNAGAAALMARPEAPEFIQFVDGDCVLEAGWIATAGQALADDPSLGIVTGWRREEHPLASPYNEACALEWDRPAGEIAACGGDMMVRSEAFQRAGGFNPAVIAAEDDEFCARIRKAGYRILRLPRPMCAHDARMLRLSQWWRRAERSGHGFAQVGRLHPEHFRPERARVAAYGMALPAAALAAIALWPPGLAGVAAIYAASGARSYRAMRGRGLPPGRALSQAGLLVLSKFPNALGMLRFWLRAASGRAFQLIEYR